MKQMKVMLHIPECVSDCSVEMIKQTKKMLEAVYPSIRVLKEHWQLSLDDNEVRRVLYQNNAQMETYWSEGWDKIGDKKLAQATVSIWTDVPGIHKNYYLGASATLIPYAKYYKLPRKNGERWIYLHFPYCVWENMDQEVFIQKVREAYITLNASYACIDEEAPMGGIYEGDFRLLSNSLHTDDVEQKMPGIYWLQIVTQNMVKNTGDISEIAKNAPCERIELTEHEGRKILLLQITSDHKKINRNRKLALRHFFKSSLYDITLDCPQAGIYWNLANWKYQMPKSHKASILRMLKMIPLTDDEINILLKPFIS